MSRKGTARRAVSEARPRLNVSWITNATGNSHTKLMVGQTSQMGPMMRYSAGIDTRNPTDVSMIAVIGMISLGNCRFTSSRVFWMIELAPEVTEVLVK